MSVRQQRSNYRIRFSEDSQASEVDNTRTEKTATQYDGPRFPNLHMMFKRRQAAGEDRTVVNRSVETVEKRRQATEEDRTVVKRSVESVEKREEEVVAKEDNVDTEADEYIKRRHQNNLQRLASMSA